MLATLIRDAYEQKDADAVAKAIDELCSPTDNLGWASAGVYIFWDFETREILYVGLAVDLAQRFRQHSGLISCKPNGCKVDQIKAYFQKKKMLGYSIFVQSPLDQPLIAKLIKTLGDIDIEDIKDLPSELGRDAIKFLEGNLIEAQVIKDAARPPWNKISGAKEGKANAKPGHHKLTLLAAKGDDSMVARATLRELAADMQFQSYEENLHAARLWQLILAKDGRPVSLSQGIQQVIKTDRFDLKDALFKEMEAAGYFSRKAPFAE
jgi:hypothetical protein